MGKKKWKKCQLSKLWLRENVGLSLAGWAWLSLSLSPFDTNSTLHLHRWKAKEVTLFIAMIMHFVEFLTDDLLSHC